MKKIKCEECQKTIPKKSGYYYTRKGRHICYNCKNSWKRTLNSQYEELDEKEKWNVLWTKAKEILKKLG